MDAYVFAGSATSQAVSTLLGSVGPNGPARVVCPLTGDRDLYVAIEAPDSTTLQQRIASVVQTEGLSNVTSHVVTAPAEDNVVFPTHASVSAFIGLVMLTPTTAAASAVARAVARVNGVVGVAVVGSNVLVEVTAANAGDIEEVFDAIAVANGHLVSFTAVGETAAGAGF